MEVRIPSKGISHFTHPTMFALISALIFCFLTAASAQDCTRSGRFTDTAGSYVFTWSVQSNFQYVDCTVTVNTPANTWAAVGFSENRTMVNTINNFMCWVFS